MNKLILVLFCSLFSVAFAQAQCITGNCQSGKGTFAYPSGAKYIGEFVNGEIHGVGVCFYSDGSKYAGQWERRYPHGKGTKTFPDGNKWTGNWYKGQPVDENGQVVEIIMEDAEANDGTAIQSGCISGDCANGKGVFAYADGSKYDGQFKNNDLDGWGTWYFPNGDKYIGTFKNSYMHGRGTLYAAAGEKTSGDWIEGEYMGDSRSELGRVGCIKGDCENGQGTYVYQDAAAKYIGTFQNGVADGRGICYYANGDRYEGLWSTGSFNGLGSLFLKDGTRVHGNWESGTYMGPAEEEVATEAIVETETTAPSAKPTATPTKEVEADIRNMKVWAVIVGISSYSHMPALRYTDDDAYRMYAFLKSPEGGALSDDRIRILIDEEATRERMIKAMEDVFGQAGPNDLVMLYFSGHGLKGSFVPIDFDGYNNKLAHEDLNAIMAKSPAKYKLCIADACHSGSLFAMKGTYESALNKYYRTLAQAEPGTALIMSSKSDETSLESSGLRQGVFSHFLIRGLKGEADVDGDRVVSVQEIYSYIHENVRAYTGMRQSPVIKGDYDPKMTVSVLR